MGISFRISLEEVLKSMKMCDERVFISNRWWYMGDEGVGGYRGELVCMWMVLKYHVGRFFFLHID